MSSIARTRLAVPAVAFFIVALCGCNSNARLTGKISYNGTQLKGGNITLIPRGDGVSISAPIREDGTYTFEKVKSGKYQVLIETESLRPPLGAAGGGSTENVPPFGANVPPGGMPGDSGAAAAGLAQRYMAIPTKYGDKNFTPLELVVKGGTHARDFPLTD